MESPSSFITFPSIDSEANSVLSNGDFLEILKPTLGLLEAESESEIPKNLFPLIKLGVLLASSFRYSASVNNGTVAALTSSLTSTQNPSN